MIFYIILGIIALAGSFKGKNKKPQTPPKQVVIRRPEAEAMAPPVQRAPATMQTTPGRPQYMTVDPSMEGSYDDPMAREFSSEGSITGSMAEAFSAEGSINDSMAAAFASEGLSSLRDSQTSDFVHTEISDTEIGDAPEYDYNSRPGGDIRSEGFDLHKAVIYSALLNRKEYSV